MSTEPARTVETGRSPQIDCPLCRSVVSEAGDVLADEREDSVQLLHCGSCGVLVSPSELTDGDADRPHQHDASRHLADQVVAGAASVAWEMAEHLAPPADSGPIVDLAVGRGGLPNALQTLGYTVVGCEPSPFLCQMARASYLLGPSTLVNTDADTFLTRLEAESTTASAVVLWQMADRHPDPLQLLRRCSRLAPGGLLFTAWPIAGDPRRSAEHRFHPTPATLLHLADELDLVVVSASVAKDGLRAFFRVPAADIVDLDQDHRHQLDIDSLDAAYRALSPAFARSVPDTSAPDTVDRSELSGDRPPG